MSTDGTDQEIVVPPEDNMVTVGPADDVIYVTS